MVTIVPMQPKPASDPAWTHREIALLFAILALAAVARIGAALAVPSPLESDYLGYWRLAGGFGAGRGLILEDGQPTAFLSIGYPIALGAVFAVFGQSIAVAKMLNIATGVLSVLFCYLAARRLFASVRVAALSGVLLAVYLEAAVYGAYVAKENLMVFLLTAQLALAASAGAEGRWRVINPILFGIATGWLMLTGNAAAAFLPGLILLAFLAMPRYADTFRWLVIGIVFAALTLAAPVYRNHQAFGVAAINNNGGFNLYIGNNPNATPYFQSIATTPLGDRWHELRARLGERGSSEHAGALALAHIVDNPGATAALALRKAIAFWEPPTHSGKYEEGRVERLVRLAWLAQYVVILLLAAAGFAAARAHRATLFAFLLMIAGYTAVHMLFYVVYRYRLPIMPFMCILAGLGTSVLWDRFASRFRIGPVARRADG
jgi:4-amino-4-deoxy-L-arabinose transferase-like glycosyltransferase